ncbi:MAG: hypothetical protein IGS49_24000 [Chlorogloeopsis fritschii C42_A2020_084]|uniref:hypothetical protein n=1 Tax=Chlorogloeopsis fritschii TaxID=1124 RepID=UPI0019DBC89E|nr:hypothetical protein [Chlorogloeopsis fritschii]MBF2008422.1 hypothetical protein [Chlorogloeopsis fritschii C42_A2020_084]
MKLKNQAFINSYSLRLCGRHLTPGALCRGTLSPVTCGGKPSRSAGSPPQWLLCVRQIHTLNQQRRDF